LERIPARAGSLERAGCRLAPCKYGGRYLVRAGLGLENPVQLIESGKHLVIIGEL
jgi:hypothetical protein